MPTAASRRSAVLYDFLQTRGGAERFTLDLRGVLPEADLWFHSASGCFDADELQGTFMLSQRPLPTRRAWRIASCMLAFLQARPRFRDYASLLVSGHYAPLACDPALRGVQHRVYYAHTTPLPFAYDAPEPGDGLAAASASRLLATWLRPRFETALHGMQRVLANSAFTAQRYDTLLGVKADVLHPPCHVERFRWQPPEGYFLSFARQEPQKRVDRIVRAFVTLPQRRLVVASDGSEHERLVQLANGAPNIEFVRGTDPARIRSLIERCDAVVHVPEQEPFGISAVEALAAGKPLVTVAEGGITEIVTDAAHGWLLPQNPDIETLAEVLSGISAADCIARREACEQRARDFDRQRFATALRAALLS